MGFEDLTPVFCEELVRQGGQRYPVLEILAEIGSFTSCPPGRAQGYCLEKEWIPGEFYYKFEGNNTRQP
jgi:hypothetical protein